jgi:hypothetical protein
MFVCLFDGVRRHFQQYFSYMVVVSFIGGRKRSIRRKTPTCRKLEGTGSVNALDSWIT